MQVSLLVMNKHVESYNINSFWGCDVIQDNQATETQFLCSIEKEKFIFWAAKKLIAANHCTWLTACHFQWCVLRLFRSRLEIPFVQMACNCNISVMNGARWIPTKLDLDRQQNMKRITGQKVENGQKSCQNFRKTPPLS